MISPLESRIMDVNSELLGISVDELMSNAGKALAEVIAERFGDKRVLFVCGKGNNGGDGFAAAALIEGADVMIFGEPKTAPALNAFSKLKKRPAVFSKEKLSDYDVIVDCALGTGLKGRLRAPYPEYIEAVNGSGKSIVSCDIPSGLGSDDCAVRPDITVTFHDAKTGMDGNSCGEIIVKDIGIPEDAYRFVAKGDMLRYPIPSADSHKGQNGRLLIIGGGPYIGAPALAGMAALRIGTDLVRIAVPESAAVAVASFSPSFVLERLPGDRLTEDSVERLLELSESSDAVLIGPGLGLDKRTVSAVRMFAKRCERPMVIDADGITAISSEIPKKNIVFTPHHSEFKRIAKERTLEQTATEEQCVILLKGPVDAITDGKNTKLNRTGNAAMTAGGTGDVLSGAVAGLLSKGMSGFDAACLGAYICGRAGDIGFEKHSYGLVAKDVADNISAVLAREL